MTVLSGNKLNFSHKHSKIEYAFDAKEQLNTKNGIRQWKKLNNITTTTKICFYQLFHN